MKHFENQSSSKRFKIVEPMICNIGLFSAASRIQPFNSLLYRYLMQEAAYLNTHHLNIIAHRLWLLRQLALTHREKGILKCSTKSFANFKPIADFLSRFDIDQEDLNGAGQFFVTRRIQKRRFYHGDEAKAQLAILSRSCTVKPCEYPHYASVIHPWLASLTFFAYLYSVPFWYLSAGGLNSAFLLSSSSLL